MEFSGGFPHPGRRDRGIDGMFTCLNMPLMREKGNSPPYPRRGHWDRRWQWREYYGGSGVRDAPTLERASPEYGDVVVLYMLPPQQGHL